MGANNPNLRGRPRKQRPASSFSDVALNAIIKAGGGLARASRREALRAALDRAVLRADIHEDVRKYNVVAVPLKVKDFEDIADVAADLLRKLAVDADGKPHRAERLRLGLQRHGHDQAKRYYRVQRREAQLDAALDRKRDADHRPSGKDARRAVQRERRVAERERQRCMDGGWPLQPHREPDQFGYGEDLALVEAVAGVRRLRTWAALEARRLAREPQSQATDDDTPWRYYTTVLIGRFADVYERFFDGPLYTAPPGGGEPYDSGIDFLRACLLALGIDEMAPGTMVKALQRWRADPR